VTVGERVVTSGMDKIFPRDLPIGTITDIKPGNPFKTIRVRPFADLERLEEVIVLLSLQPLQIRVEDAVAKSSALANGGSASPANTPAKNNAAANSSATPPESAAAAQKTPDTASPNNSDATAKPQ
jgi:hypothetical protein